MKGKRILTATLVLGLLLALAAGLSVRLSAHAEALAQGPEPQNEAQPQAELSLSATVGSKISYQGVLKENGNPVTGNRDMVFRFYDNSGCSGSPVQSVTKNNVPVDNGLFSVDLSVSQSHFNGQGLWLRVQVEGTNLGCEEILPVPYALSLRPGAEITGEDPSTLLSVENRIATGVASGIRARSWSTSGRGLYADAMAESGNTYGVYGYNKSTSGTGVFGFADADSGTTYGVRGSAHSPEGYGGYFVNRAMDAGTGVYGESRVGVWGENPSGSGTGVFGRSVDGGGVWGTSTNLYGVLGQSTNSTGVWGYSENGIGVIGESDSADGAGVLARGNDGGADLILGGHAPTTVGDDGKIYSDPAYPSSDIVLITNDTIRIDLDNDGDGEDADFEIYDKDNDRIFDVDESGEVYADGSFHSGGADFAEMLPTEEGLEPGDVLVISLGGRLARSTEPYATNVIGVYSTNPGFVGGSDEDGANPGKVPLAVVGVVPVKASAESGPIKPGDLLTTSSTPGHAMRADHFVGGAIIGKALEGLSEGTDVIKMLVMLQ